MPSLPSLSFILGGARSGKSSHAQRLAEACGNRPLMIATAQAFDDEMRERIALHQAERGEQWITIEAPIDLPGAIAQVAGDVPSVIVVDCLTLWLTNLILADLDIASASAALLDACRATPHPVILVSNETGLGIVPVDPLSRRFRDEAGRLHQRVAADADDVTLMVAGLAMAVKARDQR